MIRTPSLANGSCVSFVRKKDESLAFCTDTFAVLF